MFRPLPCDNAGARHKFLDNEIYHLGGNTPSLSPSLPLSLSTSLSSLSYINHANLGGLPYKQFCICPNLRYNFIAHSELGWESELTIRANKRTERAHALQKKTDLRCCKGKAAGGWLGGHIALVIPQFCVCAHTSEPWSTMKLPAAASEVFDVGRWLWRRRLHDIVEVCAREPWIVEV